MLFCHKVIYKVKEKGIRQYAEFVDLLDDAKEGNDLRAYMNLGSLGPDIFYYAKLIKGAIDLLKDGYVMARGVEPWSYHLHSVRPNEFPLKLIEIVFRDAKTANGKTQWEFEDYARLAFIAGYLTHMAFDQIVHPLVNQVAGPYYRSGDFRKNHRECEIFQDYFLYETVYRLEEKSGDKYDFFKQDFNVWADCVRGARFRNTEDWFRYFIQRGFAETYNVFPDEDLIEDSVDNLLLTLRISNKFGPYKTAAKEYRRLGEKAPEFKKYIAAIDYMKFYDQALELGAVYLMAFYEVYALLKKNGDFTKQQSDRFKDIVSEADLSSPLEQNILKKAIAALRKTQTMDTKIASVQKLIRKAKFAGSIS
jgi:hypothetical protein